MKRLGFAIVLGFILGAAVSCAGLDGANDPGELERTWDAALVFLPADGLHIPNADAWPGPALRLVMKPARERGDFDRIPGPRKYPAIIYLHGCTGMHSYNEDSGAYLAANLGVAVILPDSFAREYRPSNCNPKTKTGGMFRQALRFRIAEANHAIREARKLAWIDADNLFLMGFSEGGITTAKFTGEKVNARIIEGATCHLGWRDWDGLDAPESEPVLSLLGGNDPWQRGKPWSGRDCGSRMSHTNGSRSIVITEGPYADRHAVLMDPDVRAAVAAFIDTHSKP